MSEMDFHIEFNVELPELSTTLMDEVAVVLRELSRDYNDLTGAAVSVEKIAGVESAYIYRARIVVYRRPENLVAIKEAQSAEIALRDALETVEDRVRSDRTRLGKHWQRPDLVKSDPVYELSEEEIYAAYGKERDLQDFLQKSSAEIAAEMMVNHKLAQDAAYYVAGILMEYTRNLRENDQNRG
jgi:hypothetical protein